ncbi:Vitamin B12 transporter BtuB [Nymphon striatum]|nr:Vitamin B12 transporter BtuB [Nymphon striatum]
MGYDLSENTTLYGNAAYVYKSVNSFANYRVPYWRTVDDFPYLADFFPGENPNTAGGYDGYVPTFEVNNSHNRNVVLSPSTWVDADGNGSVDDGELTEGSELYRANSQQSFDPGGTKFSHNVGNIDISRLLSDKVSIGVGAEFRTETFEVIEGELASYDGGGADSFAGASPQNSGKFNRYNIGGYLSLDYDVTDAFLLSGTIRTENYSDFGNAFVYKFSSRYKISDAFTLRGSISSGFRAPTLHQIYTQKAQYSFITWTRDTNAETSQNFTVGFGGKIDKFSYTLDYYSIAVKDRIVLGTEIGASGDAANPLDVILNNNNLSDVSFFSNAIDTRTSGIDVVLGYRGIELGEGKLDLNLSGNYTLQNELDGDIKDIPLVANSDPSIFTEFTPKVVTDLGVNFNATEKFTIALNINNLLNILPEWSFIAKNAAGQSLIDDTTYSAK